ncbi:hypothetical protein [uncultured Eubacterium sp.]|uniref:hypothetical protein n=1 Tax=uncultured Eubacterium sp. TaxID=165185 RepID=UPI0025E7E948|nr:hypothetical protein [uncultured Eubacterium sp.]
MSDLNSFWSWAYSNIMDNAERGALAEYLVAYALGVADNIRVNWDKYDLLSPEGIAVEVKSSGYLQSWDQEKLSALSFGIQPTFGWDSTTNTYSQELTRQSDIYVFCVHKHTDQDTVNPLDIAQWDFYLLPTKVLNAKACAQKRANLPSLIKMGAEKCDFEHIHARIVELIQKEK